VKKKREKIDTYVLEAMGKTKAMWQLINRGIGKVPMNDLRLELRIRKSIVTNTTEVAEKLNSYFTSSVDVLVKQKNYEGNYNISQHKIINFQMRHPCHVDRITSIDKNAVRHNC
jgi:hypothetical protein